VKKPRKKSESLEPLINFLALVVLKLWPKNNKLINNPLGINSFAFMQNLS